MLFVAKLNKPIKGWDSWKYDRKTGFSRENTRANLQLITVIWNSSVSKYQSLIVQVRKIIVSWTVSIVYLKRCQPVPFSNSEDGLVFGNVNLLLLTSS